MCSNQHISLKILPGKVTYHSYLRFETSLKNSIRGKDDKEHTIEILEMFKKSL